MNNLIDESLVETLMNNLSNDQIEKVVVGAIIMNDGGQILLLRRSAGDFMGGLVELPSGGVDQGEDIFDALTREITEETGLTVTSVDRYVGHFDYTSGSGKKTRQLNFVVSAHGEVHVNPDEHDDFLWVSVTDDILKKSNISAETRRIIELAML